LHPEKASQPEQRALLYHEATVGKQMAHPNVIRIVYVHKDNKNPYFVMEYFPGGSVRARMQAKQTEFLREHLHSILKQTATGLAYTNASKWVHRDVKPDNILCNAAGEVKLIDFALATRVQKQPGFLGRLFGRMRRRKPKAVGTRSYMSPEQIRGQAIDGRADVYSFGVTCYELGTGRTPFVGVSSQDLLTKHVAEKPVTPRSHNPDVTDEFAELVLRMLGKKREDRPRDFHEVLMQLRTMKIYKSVETKPRPDEAG